MYDEGIENYCVERAWGIGCQGLVFAKKAKLTLDTV